MSSTQPQPQISKELAALLTAEQRKTAAALGLLPAIEEKEKGKGKGKGKGKVGLHSNSTKRDRKTIQKVEYILGVSTTCSCCGDKRVEIYEMISTDGALVKRPASPLQYSEPDKWASLSLKNCKNCRAILLTLSKEELVAKILKEDLPLKETALREGQSTFIIEHSLFSEKLKEKETSLSERSEGTIDNKELRRLALAQLGATYCIASQL